MSADRDYISPDIRAALAKLPSNDPARRQPPERRVTYRDARWSERPHAIRGVVTNAPHGTLLEADDEGATYALKF